MTLCWVLAGVILEVLGVVGCFVPVLPGPVLAYAGLLCLWPLGRLPGWGWMAGFGVLTVVVTALDYLVPIWGAKVCKSSCAGLRGSFVGTIVGLFFLPWGLLLGPFFGAMLGELTQKRPLAVAARSGLGALVGVLGGIFVKTVACVVMGLAFWFWC